MENVIVLTFPAVDKAQDAFRSLKRLDETGDVEVAAAAVVERSRDGRSVVLDVSEAKHAKGTAAAGALGGVLGLTTGPIGAVVGGVGGAFVGSLADVADVDRREQLLRAFGRAIPPGSSAAIAVVDEETPAPIDVVTSRLGGRSLRTPRREVPVDLDAGAGVVAGPPEGYAERSIGDQLRDVKDAVRGGA